jgi:hypothetical protein
MVPRAKAKSLVEYDALGHRVWIFGQRCHHGATGSVVATVAFLGLAIGPVTEARQLGNSRSMLALAAAGGALMVHDWKDRSVWFAREPGPRAAAA